MQTSLPATPRPPVWRRPSGPALLLVCLACLCMPGLFDLGSAAGRRLGLAATATRPAPPPVTPQPAVLEAEIEALKSEVAGLREEVDALRADLDEVAGTKPGPIAARLDELNGQPCPNSDFTCVTLTVPRDHFNPEESQTLDVVFGVLPATGDRKGMLVIATGGPGSSGLAVADAYTAGYAPAILKSFDLVFFDQRGVSASGDLECPEAAATYFEADAQAATPAQEAALVDAAETFAAACPRELAAPDLLPYLGTGQAVEDLDTFRQAFGEEKFWLYGESYGTHFAQVYAAAHPDRLAGLILDGTVDLALSGSEFQREQAQAFNDVLLLTLAACDADEDCAADMGRKALAVYDDLAARLAERPRTFDFPLSSGKTVRRSFDLSDLERVASINLYSEDDRMLLLRALAAAERDDLVPLARLLYYILGLDPDTLAPSDDPTFSDAMLYAVNCRDYTYFPGRTPAEQAKAYLRAGDVVEAGLPRFSSVFYDGLPCLFWPVPAEPARPVLTPAPDVPTLVLGSTADPATPVGQGERVYHRLADAYLITTEGGPHVTFGWGNACPDNIVTAFLLRDRRPLRRETSCTGRVIDPYVPLPAADASAYDNPLMALLSADNEIYYLPEYYNWDQVTPTAAGCPAGGTLSFESAGSLDQLTLTGCAFSAGFAMTGSGTYDYDTSLFTLDVKVAGLAEGTLSYERDASGAIRVVGDYDGEPVDLAE